MVKAVVLTSHSLERSEQKVSEVLEQLSASQTRERAISETSKIDKATFEEARKLLESRVGSLQAELDRSRESYVVWFISRLDVLIPLQRRPSEHPVAGMEYNYTMLRQNPRGLLDDESGTARPV